MYRISSNICRWVQSLYFLTTLGLGLSKLLVSALPEGSTDCVDFEGWVDAQGIGCSHYETDGCDGAHLWANEDAVSALDACCVCTVGWWSVWKMTGDLDEELGEEDRELEWVETEFFSSIVTEAPGIDECPDDGDKTEPGVCGCGVEDVDTDGDLTYDCADGCPDDVGKTAAGACGCGVADTDGDGDGILDCYDDCPADANKATEGVCGCGVADADTDSDGTVDCEDVCPNDPLKDTDDGVCGCDVADVDTDGDGTLDCEDGCPDDASKTEAGVCGCGVADTDGDGDGTLDCNDECPVDENKSQQGVCGCGAVDGDANAMSGCTNEDGEDLYKVEIEMELTGETASSLTEEDIDQARQVFADLLEVDLSQVSITIVTNTERRRKLRDGHSPERELEDTVTISVTIVNFESAGKGELAVQKIVDAEEDGSLVTDMTDAGLGVTSLVVEDIEYTTDLCPLDATKVEPGECGCGTPDEDNDNNNIYDCKPENDDTQPDIAKISSGVINHPSVSLCMAVILTLAVLFP